MKEIITTEFQNVKYDKALKRWIADVSKPKTYEITTINFKDFDAKRKRR